MGWQGKNYINRIYVKELPTSYCYKNSLKFIEIRIHQETCGYITQRFRMVHYLMGGMYQRGDINV